MKSDATKQKFIQLRAEGLSYAKISDQLHLSKATCSKWESKFTEEIAELKRDHLQELYEAVSYTHLPPLTNYHTQTF